jgi:hypothetical protein
MKKYRAISQVLLLLCTILILSEKAYSLDGRPWPKEFQSIFDGKETMLCPLPQNISWEEGNLDLSNGLVIVKDFHNYSKLDKAIDLWAEQLKERSFGNVKIVAKDEKAPAGYTKLVLTQDELHLPDSVRLAMPVDANSFSGYVLHVSAKEIVLKGGGENGIFYGLQTLKQLIQGKNQKWFSRCTTISDWPHKKVRGFNMMMPGREDLVFYYDVIDYMAELKYNQLMIMIDGGMEFKRHPEINTGWEAFIDSVYNYPGGGNGMQESQGRPKNAIHFSLGGGSYITQEETRELVQYAKDHYIDVIPYVQSLSHSYYLLWNHRELAENQDDPYPDHYCPSNPASYDLLFDVIDEVIDVFEPQWLHIGHDEAYTFGLCDRCKDKDPVDLYAGDVVKIHDYLATRGIKTMMWADKFLNIAGPIGTRYGGIQKRWPNRVKGGDYFMPEIYPAIDKIPKDIVMMDWYYSLSPFTQDFFAQKGFQVIFGNFAFNVPHWEFRSRIPNVQGGVISGWTINKEYGYARDNVIYNHISSSNMLWWAGYENNRADSIQKLLQRAVRHYRNLFSHNLYPSVQNDTPKFHAVNLQKNANALAAGFYPAGKKYDFTFLKSGKNVIQNIEVQFPEFNKSENSVISLGPNTDTSIKLVNLGFKAASLAFVHTVMDAGSRSRPILEKFVAPETELFGEYLVRYSDASTQTIPMRYKVNLFDFYGPVLENYYYADLVQQTYLDRSLYAYHNRRSQRENLFMFEWINPWPEKKIASLDFIYKDPQEKAQLFLLGLTGLELKDWEPNAEDILKRNQFLINGVENERLLSTPRAGE